MAGLTRGKAIHAFCKECIYDPCSGGGTWVQQAEACAISKCPLWAFRPKSRGVKAEA